MTDSTHQHEDDIGLRDGGFQDVHDILLAAPRQRHEPVDPGDIVTGIKGGVPEDAFRRVIR